jgi:hypothetical protein
MSSTIELPVVGRYEGYRCDIAYLRWLQSRVLQYNKTLNRIYFINTSHQFFVTDCITVLSIAEGKNPLYSSIDELKRYAHEKLPYDMEEYCIALLDKIQ